jgi:thymidine kinase
MKDLGVFIYKLIRKQERRIKIAKLYFRYGAMGSGKTRDLMKTYYNYTERNMRAVIMKPAIDTKGGCKICSRDGSLLPIDYLVEKGDDLFKIIKKEIKISKHPIHCILVDEAEFLEEKQIDELTDIVDYLDIPVICHGLRADFRTNLFPGSRRLFELADSIEELKTVCFCGRKATMNTRMVNGKYVFHGDQVAIDGEGSVTYNSLCRSCYKKEKDKANKK